METDCPADRPRRPLQRGALGGRDTLVAWRWLLTHPAAARMLKTRNIDAELARVAALEQQVLEFGQQLRRVEVRAAGR